MSGKPVFNPSEHLMKKHEGRNYSTQAVLDELEKRFDKALASSDERFTEKNLIYFTLNYNLDYLDLFFYCIKSIVDKDNKDKFDFLVICPPVFERIIREIMYDKKIKLNGFNLYFFHVPEATDGIDASMNKLKIHQWKYINHYGKVLFLDADILARKPVSELFDLDLDSNIFYSAIHTMGKAQNLHNSKFHKITNYSSLRLTMFRDMQLTVFNAGQFLFVNSKRMLHHLYNVEWLSRAWPDEFFFEQSFLNHYFNYFYLSDTSTLNDKVKFVAVHLWDKGDGEKAEKPDPNIIHFAGHACDASKKIEYIKEFDSELIPNLYV